MAIATINIANFSLNSTWTAKITPGSTVTPYITPDPPTVGSTTRSVNLGAIPAGSTINSATLTATFGSTATGVRLNTANFNGSSDAAFGSGSLNVKAQLDALGGTYGAVPILFRFGANGSTAGATVNGASKYDTLAYSSVKLTVDYTEPPPANCTPPTSVQPNTSADKGTNATVTFSGATAGANNPITGYKIYRGATANGTYYFLDETSTASTSGSFSVTAPTTAGTTYYYKIQTIGTLSGYDSAHSTEYASITATEPTAASCSPPTNVQPRASAIKGTTVQVTFSGAAAGVSNPITGYKIYRGASVSGTFYFLADMASTATSGSFDVVAPTTAGTTYYYKIQTLGTQAGYDSARSTEYASITATEAPAPADLPSALALNKTTCKAGSGIRATFGVKTAGATHRVQYISGATATYADLTDSEHVFVVPLNWQNQIPNTTTLSVRVVLSTYKGLPQNSSTFIGSVEKTFTMTLSDDAYPSIGSMGTTRVANGVPAAITRYVQNKTKCYVAILNAQGAYGSTITNYTVTGNGQTFNNSSGTFGVFPTAGTVTFTGTAKDSRGRSKNASVTITVDPYSAPSLTKIQAYRSISNGTANTSGTYLSLKATTVFSSLGGQNAVTLQGRFAQRGGSYGAWNAMTSNTLKILSGLLAVYSYTAQINVIDTLDSSYTYTATIPPDSVSFNLMDGGTGAAFGKYAESAGYVELAANWGLMFNTGSIMRGANLRYASRLLNTSPDENLNDITEEWVVARNTSVNIPNSSYFFYVHTVSLSSSRMQVAYGYNATNLAYYRSLYNGTWTAWRSI